MRLVLKLFFISNSFSTREELMILWNVVWNQVVKGCPIKPNHRTITFQTSRFHRSILFPSIFLRYHFSLTDGKREELSSNPIFTGKVSTSEEAVNRARISALAVVVERNAVIWRPISLVQLLMQSVLPEWLSVSVSVCGAAAPIRLLYADEWAAHWARALPTRSQQPIQPHQPGI